MKTIRWVGLCLIALLFAACKGKPEEPDNESKKKGHDEASQVEITFTEGELFLTEEDQVYASAFSRNKTTPVQRVTYTEGADRRWVLEGAPQLKQDVWYEMKISLRNKTSDITDQFVATPEMRAIHQFFFELYRAPRKGLSADKILEAKYKPAEYPMELYYGDVDVEGNIIKPALGFRTFIRLSADAPRQLWLRYYLIHIFPPAVKTRRDGSSYPYNQPPRELGATSDVDFDVPITKI